MENQNNFKRLNYFFAFTSFIIPIIWNGFDFVNLGGDDTRLYLIKPLNWILNYSSNFFSFTYIGNYPKEIFGLFQNTTYLVLNNIIYEEFSSATDYAFVSLMCYLSLNTILSDLNLNYSFNAKLLPFLYSMTPLGSMLLFNNGGLWIYVLSVLPFIIRNFYMFIFSGKIKFLLFFLLFSFLFSSVYSIKSIHFSIPLFIVITFTYINKFYNYEKLKIFFFNFLKISIIFCICNFHLLVFIYLEFSNKFYESLNYLPFSNIRISYFFDNLKYLGDNFNSFFFLTHLNHNLFSNHIIYSKFIFLILSLLYLFLIFNSKLILSINKNLLIILICFFIFQNMNYAFFEILFSYLFQNIPFIHMFSNYHSKFAYPFLIILIIFLARIIANNHLLQIKYVKNFITLNILIITAYGVMGKFNDNTIFQTNDIYSNNNLNNDYFEVLDVIKKNESIYSYGNIFQIPISREYDLYLDKNIGYVGPSLIQPYIGIKHIINNDYSNLNKKFIKNFQNSILERSFDDFLKSLNSKNIAYIIINKNDLFDLRYYLINYNFYNENLNYINKFLNDNKLKLLFENNSYKIFFLKNIEKNCQYKLINSSIIKVDKNSICGTEKKTIVEKVLRDTNSNIKFVYDDWVNISDVSKFNFVLKKLFNNIDKYNYIINKNDLIFKISSLFSFFCYTLIFLYSILFFILKRSES